MSNIKNIGHLIHHLRGWRIIIVMLLMLELVLVLVLPTSTPIKLVLSETGMIGVFGSSQISRKISHMESYFSRHC